MLKRGVPRTPEAGRAGDAARTTPASGAHAKRRMQAQGAAAQASPAARTPLRNALSELGAQSAGSAGTLSPGGLPQSPSNASVASLNDDDGERRGARAALQRSRSEMRVAMLEPAAHSSPRAEAPRTGVPLVASRRAGRRQGTAGVLADIIARSTAAVGAQSSTQVSPPSAELSLSQRSEIFEEWIKAAAENKISAKNSWSVALIDYFSELTFVRDSSDGGINFQKASCTLDGCVKVYATRVDTVAQASARLLSLLAAKGAAQEQEEEGDNEGAEAAAPEGPRRKERPRSAGRTLEKSWEALNVRNAEDEFGVDPLFRKTSALFDEGRAGVFLTAALPLGDDGRILFDAHDAPPALRPGPVSAEPSFEVPRQLLSQFGAEIAGLSSLEMTPSLSGVPVAGAAADSVPKPDRMAADAVARLAAAEMRVDSDDSESDSDAADVPDAPLDAFGLELEPSGAYVPALGDDVLDAARASMAVSPEDDGDARVALMMAAAVGDDALFADIDARAARNWAGPAHWRGAMRPHLRRVPLTGSAPGPASADAPTRRAPRQADTLDFHVPPAPGYIVRGSAALLTLGRAALEERRQKDNLLPEDIHFSSARLMHLFTNARWRVGARRPGRPAASRLSVGLAQLEASIDAAAAPIVRDDLAPEHIEPSFWADAPAPEPEVDMDAPAEVPALSVPEDDDDGLADSFGRNLVLTRPAAKALVLDVARPAPRVDVAALKARLWASVSAALAAGGTARLADAVAAIRAADGDDAPSAAYCFICVLHLANEHGLDLAGADGADVLISRGC